MMFQGRFKAVSRVLKFKGVSRKFQGRFQNISRVFQGRLKGVSMEFYMGFNSV